MKGASWVVAGGTVAGLVAVLTYHTEAMPASSLAGSTTTGAGATATPSATPSSTGSAAPSKGTGSTASGSATGPTVQFGYGDIAVKATVQNGKITNLAVPTLQTAEPTSQQLSDEAISILTHEILSAQSLSNVQAVSGATYTSEAYAQSLQSALGKLHFK
jgi:uncharacterized protein with FMN-binding domain